MQQTADLSLQAYRHSFFPLLTVLGCALAIAGCEADAGPVADSNGQCVAQLALDCQPAYTPSFDAIFDDVLSTTCAASSTGGSCHYGPDSRNAAGMLALSDRQAAYDALLGHLDGRARVVANDPKCSVLVERLESTDASFRMPVGDTLAESKRCAVRQWIANGAVR